MSININLQSYVYFYSALTFSHRLAAVQDGQYCFCFDDESLLSGATKTSDSLCSIICHHNASGETCGGYLHNEVFKVPDLVEGLILHDPGVNGKCL